MLREFIRKCGYDFIPDQLDSSFHEFETEKHKGWYIGTELGDGKYLFSFGDWRLGEKFSAALGVDSSETFKEELEELEELKEKARTARHERAERAASRALNYIDTLKKGSGAGASAYLKKKNIDRAPLGVFTDHNSWGEADLIIPMYSLEPSGTGDLLWNYQRIQPNGFKQFSEGGRVSGCFHIVGRLGISNPEGRATSNIFICEGYATGVSIHRSLTRLNFPDFCVVVSFNTQNLPKVTKAFLERGRDRLNVFICADNDTKTEKKLGENPGLLAAQRAAELCGAKILVPRFSDREPGSDWNDFEQIFGEKNMDHELDRQLSSEEKLPEILPKEKKQKTLPHFVEPYANGLPPLMQQIGPDGKPKAFEELEVAHYVLEYLKRDGGICKFDSDVYTYNGKYWEQLTPAKKDYIKVQILVAMKGKASSKKVDSVYSILEKIIPRALMSPYMHKENLINVANGTIHLEKGENGWSFKLYPHNPNDFLTTYIPYPYLENEPLGKLFSDMLGNIFSDDEEREDKIKLLQEMYGSCLAPKFPRLFLIWGRGGSGKTSLIIPAIRLVDEKNTSMVEPSKMEGFTMSAMAGKLVNYVADIDINEPIRDNIVKQIEDRLPVIINRKFKEPFIAHIPLVHIFAGNAIPPTLERGSGAYLRRWSFIHCKSMDKSKNPTFNFANKAFDENPSGILAWALEGLVRLLNNDGRFTEFASDREKVESWQTEHDFIHQFLLDIGIGEVPRLRYNVDGKVNRSLIWEVFVEWHEDSYNRLPRIGRNKFYAALEEKIVHRRNEELKNNTGNGAEHLRFSVFEGIRIVRGVESTRGPDLAF